MNCAIKLKGYEVAGSTFQDRKFIFTDRDISGDVFTAVVYNSFSKKNNIEGLKVGNEVFFPYSTLENLKTGRYRIEFWATMAGIGKEMIALEEFFISSDPSCTNGSNETNVSITFKEEVINFTIQTALMYKGSFKWGEIEDKPVEFPPSAHTHQWDKIEDKPTVFYDDTEIKEEIAKKVDKVAGKGLSDNNYSTADKTKLASLENYDDTAIQTELDTKVDKVAGKSLSTNDFTDAERTKLENLQNFDPSGIIQDLGNKVDKPAGTGGFFASQSGTTTTWVQISPASYYLNYWDGSNFRASNVYQNGTKLGIGTQTPSEMLHLYDGRIRAKALVLDVNSETLPNQIVTDGTRFSGTSSGGTKRGLMYNDYADLLALSNGMTDAQKTEWKTAMNGGWTTNTMSVGSVSPKVVKNSNLATYITVEGANLNLNPANFSLKLVDTITGVETVVPNSQVQLQTNGLSLIFWYNFSTLPISDYYIRLDNGVAILTTNSATSLLVRSTVQNIDLSLLTWSRVCVTQSEIDNTLITGVNSFIFHQNANNTAFVNNNASVVAAAKSSQILSIGDNLVINGNIQIKAQNGVYNGFILGLAKSSISTQLVNVTDVSIGFTADGSNWLYISKIINNVKSTLPSISLTSSTNLNLGFTIVKQGNVISITWRYTDQYNNTTSATVNKTITDTNYSLYLVGTSGNITGDNTIIINDIYKF